MRGCADQFCTRSLKSLCWARAERNPCRGPHPLAGCGRTGAGRRCALACRPRALAGPDCPRRRFLSGAGSGQWRHLGRDRRKRCVSGLIRLNFTLTAKPDRVDSLPDGRVHIFDYKTGKPPSEDRNKANSSKQLLLEAAMAERGAFQKLGPASRLPRLPTSGLGPPQATVETSDHRRPAGQGLGRSAQADWPLHVARTRLSFAHRHFKERFPGDYDHLARLGEWDMSDDPQARGCDMRRDDATMAQIQAADPARLDVAVGQCWLWQNPRADRPCCAVAAVRRRSRAHSVPDLYQSRRVRDAEPAVQTPWRLGDAGR